MKPAGPPDRGPWPLSDKGKAHLKGDGADLPSKPGRGLTAAQADAMLKLSGLDPKSLPPRPSDGMSKAGMTSPPSADIRPTVVFIWNNNHGIPYFGKQDVLGHVALAIGGPDSVDAHVGWWPAKREEGDERWKNGRKKDPALDLREDVISEKYAPDHVIVVDDLDTDNMKTKWREINDDPLGQYHYYKNNCSTVADRVLRAGMLKTGVSGKFQNIGIQTPLQVKRLAFSLGGKAMEWEAYARANGLDDLADYKKRSSDHGDARIPARFDHGVDTGENVRKPRSAKPSADEQPSESPGAPAMSDPGLQPPPRPPRNPRRLQPAATAASGKPPEEAVPAQPPPRPPRNSRRSEDASNGRPRRGMPAVEPEDWDPEADERLRQRPSAGRPEPISGMPAPVPDAPDVPDWDPAEDERLRVRPARTGRIDAERPLRPSRTPRRQ